MAKLHFTEFRYPFFLIFKKTPLFAKYFLTELILVQLFLALSFFPIILKGFFISNPILGIVLSVVGLVGFVIFFWKFFCKSFGIYRICDNEIECVNYNLKEVDAEVKSRTGDIINFCLWGALYYLLLFLPVVLASIFFTAMSPFFLVLAIILLIIFALSIFAAIRLFALAMPALLIGNNGGKASYSTSYKLTKNNLFAILFPMTLITILFCLASSFLSLIVDVIHEFIVSNAFLIAVNFIIGLAEVFFITIFTSYFLTYAYKKACE